MGAQRRAQPQGDRQGQYLVCLQTGERRGARKHKGGGRTLEKGGEGRRRGRQAEREGMCMRIVYEDGGMDGSKNKKRRHKIGKRKSNMKEKTRKGSQIQNEIKMWINTEIKHESRMGERVKG